MSWDVLIQVSLLLVSVGAFAYLALGIFSFAEKTSPAPAAAPTEKFGTGNHLLEMLVDRLKRTAVVHVPPNYDPGIPTPLVLALHGAAMNGGAMSSFSGLTATSDEKGFIIVYPTGTGRWPLTTWNAGGFAREVSRADDVGFLSQLLDQVCLLCNVDPKRIYACGLSNGGMMCYRLAGELSNRIAAIATVGGTMPESGPKPSRPVPLIHFHGTDDILVPYNVNEKKPAMLLRVKSAGQTIQTWLRLNGCPEQPISTDVLSRDGDELKVVRQTYGPGTNGAEVVLVTVEGGGHTWPGQVPPFKILGKSALNVSANDLIWEFFEKHPLK